MGIEHIIAFNIALFAALLSPGPALLVALRNTARDGRRAGMATGLGLGLVAAGWTGAALLGLEAIFAAFPWAYAGLRLTGALYLIYLAYRTWRHAPAPAGDAPPARHRAFATGVLVNLANPKSVLFAGAVLLVVFPGGLSAPQMAVVTLNHLVVEWCFYSALAALVGHQAVRARYMGAKPVLDRLAACLMGALGLKLLTER